MEKEVLLARCFEKLSVCGRRPVENMMDKYVDVDEGKEQKSQGRGRKAREASEVKRMRGMKISLLTRQQALL